MKIRFSKIIGIPAGYFFGLNVCCVGGNLPGYTVAGVLSIELHWRFKRYKIEWMLIRGSR
jgi:hypothetical protein